MRIEGVFDVTAVPKNAFPQAYLNTCRGKRVNRLTLVARDPQLFCTYLRSYGNGLPTSLPGEFFNGDPVRDVAALDMDLELVHIMCLGANGRDNRTALVAHFEGTPFASKGGLGLLHEDRTRTSPSTEELELIDRLVP